jgi:hypothetical protein
MAVARPRKNFVAPPVFLFFFLLPHMFRFLVSFTLLFLLLLSLSLSSTPNLFSSLSPFFPLWLSPTTSTFSHDNAISGNAVDHEDEDVVVVGRRLRRRSVPRGTIRSRHDIARSELSFPHPLTLTPSSSSPTEATTIPLSSFFLAKM